MIIGAHAIIYSTNPAADRAFLRDVLEPVKGSALDIPVIRDIGMMSGQSHGIEARRGVAGFKLPGCPRPGGAHEHLLRASRA